ncbi:CRISPR-associated protein Cas1 [Xenorhabdus khoisanae]|uniref:CRISPR-associated protein Cas1 n=1 Tax=Xenorhabdus khoisanae TaxID=880157 RepID=A0A0J5FR04_9GAMM|nr:CRISPR-associated endonuclease Cas1 [Xenorhabdus khoisanae]KMJ44382.1 CRISPR-associated protein Cas1 [Xenorhabdus khoisanae]
MAFIPLKPIPIKDRNSMIFIGMGRIDVKDNAFVVIDEVNGERMHIPVGSIACIMLEPGTRISHAAVKLASTTGTLLIWVGEAGVRLYSVGQPGGARSDRLLYQAKLALDEDLRLKVVRKMFELRFGEPAPQKRNVEQLRGIEGARVRKIYQILAKQYGVSKPLSFVYDIADILKFDTVVPIAFKVAATNSIASDRQVRIACREKFRTDRILKRLIPLIEEVLAAGEISPPLPPADAQPPAIPEPISIGDIGHRSQ